ncbi:histidine phosphatase family protein [Reinekea marina]|uniref:Histidine phosphatase family protein n=1 Tax=Reinekea marina TaxID=1310421 RepID=A0ABV7WRT8_9GAMM|nr:histidine phosphatase family protein [Reinekea marina]MDN3650917.1 histidine phosphatase family protein [Reinekea marina]
MKIVYLVRHGQASFGEKDYDQLSPTGCEQSQLVGQALRAKNVNVDRLELGSLQRHKQTCEHAYENKRPTHENQQWNEFDHKDITAQYLKTHQLHRDEFLDLSDIDKMAMFSKAMVQWVEADANGTNYRETWPQFKSRANHALQQLIQQTQQAAIVFTSGGVISNIVAHIMQLSSLQALMLNRQLVNTGITKLLITRNGLQVSTLNEYVHIEQQNNKKLITYR